MGWKRFEKEFRKAGKSVENEAKRVAARLDNEATKLAEQQLKRKTDSSSCESEPTQSNVVNEPTHSKAVENEPSNSNAIENEPKCSQSIDNPPVEVDEIKNPESLEPGIAFIINHYTFHDSKLRQRIGSLADVARLNSIFKKFGMEVEEVFDGNCADIKAAMEKISLLDFSNMSCLVIVIMSHGYEGNIVAAKDGEYSIDHNIMYPILRNRTLSSKLKLLVVQACKGPVNPMLEIEGPLVRPTAIPAEILQITSCVEGYVSYLDTQKGSIFITTLCDHLEQSGHERNILDIANAVVADVKEKYCDIQIPMIHTNMTKKFVFGHYAKN